MLDMLYIKLYMRICWLRRSQICNLSSINITVNYYFVWWRATWLDTLPLMRTCYKYCARKVFSIKFRRTKFEVTLKPTNIWHFWKAHVLFNMHQVLKPEEKSNKNKTKSIDVSQGYAWPIKTRPLWFNVQSEFREINTTPLF